MAIIGRQLVDQFPISSSNTLTYGLVWLPTDYTTAVTTRYPLIIFLHGGGETGTGVTGLNNLITTALPQKIAQGFNVEASGKKFIVVSPQAPSGSYFHSHVQYILPDIISRYRVDVNQIYITGLSYGGGGTWRCVTNGLPLAEKFAAILPVSSIEVETAAETAEIANITKVHDVKVWGIVGADDGLVDVTKRYIALVNSTSPTVPAKFTAIPGAGHSSATWNTIYDPAWKDGGLNVYEWMLQYSRSGVQPPLPTTTSTTSTTTKTPTTTTSTTVKPTTTSTTTSTSTSTSTTTSSTTTTTKAPTTTTTSSTTTSSTTTTTTAPITGKRIYVAPGIEGGRTIDGTTFPYSPGDTLVLKATDVWTYLYIKEVHGTASAPVNIINEGGEVTMSAGLSLFNCTYIKADFTGFSATQYGLRINSPGRAAWAVSVQGKSSHIEFGHIHIEPAFYGFLIKNEADCDTTVNDWVMDDFYIHDNYIKNMDSQGMYLGSTDPSNLARPIVCNGVQVWYAPSRLGNFRIMNNVIQDTGRPGIQLSCASTGMSEISGNTISNTGLQGDDAQGAGIILGGYSRAYIHGNNIKNTYTWGIASFGSGLVRIESNLIDATGSNSIGTLPWGAGIVIDTRTTTPVDLTAFSIKSNVLSHIAQVPHIEIGQLFKTYATGNVICNNTTDGTPSIVSVDPGIDWSTDCGITPPIPPVQPTTTSTSTTSTTTKAGSSTTTTTTSSTTPTIVLDITINTSHYTLYSDKTWK